VRAKILYEVYIVSFFSAILVLSKIGINTDRIITNEENTALPGADCPCLYAIGN
jgi:hypothetical protein